MASTKGPYGVGSRKGLNLTRELSAGGGREAKGLAGMGVSNPSPTAMLCKPEDATLQLFHGALHLEPGAAPPLSVWGPALWCMRTSSSLRETLTQHNHKKGPKITVAKVKFLLPQLTPRQPVLLDACPTHLCVAATPANL